MKLEELEIGKIYFISYGENTQVVGMVKQVESLRIILSFYHHYWNGFESLKRESYVVTSGIESIREASKSEKHNLLKSAIEYNLV